MIPTHLLCSCGSVDSTNKSFRTRAPTYTITQKRKFILKDQLVPDRINNLLHHLVLSQKLLQNLSILLRLKSLLNPYTHGVDVHYASAGAGKETRIPLVNLTQTRRFQTHGDIQLLTKCKNHWAHRSLQHVITSRVHCSILHREEVALTTLVHAIVLAEENVLYTLATLLVVLIAFANYDCREDTRTQPTYCPSPQRFGEPHDKHHRQLEGCEASPLGKSESSWEDDPPSSASR